MLKSHKRHLLKGLEKIALKSKGVLSLCLEPSSGTSLQEQYSILHENIICDILNSHISFQSKSRGHYAVGRFLLLGLSSTSPLNNSLQIVVNCCWSLQKLSVPCLHCSRSSGCAVACGVPPHLRQEASLCLENHRELESLLKAVAVFLLLRLFEMRISLRKNARTSCPQG